ncbi:MAG: hypothetical protein V4858_22945 [Pseudomonadota bacterium]
MAATNKRQRWRLVLATTVVLASAQMFAAPVPPTKSPLQSSTKAAGIGTPAQVVRANFLNHAASRQVRKVADQIVAFADHNHRPFLIVDKVHTRLFVFGADGTLHASAPILIGAARGDDSVPGIGLRKIADIRPFERTTPAGRFLAEAGRNTKGEDIVWVDYDAAVSMHRVRATNPAERRLQRLATPTAADNRISYGCINVPVAFFDEHVGPIFHSGKSYVYVLPEVRSAADVFRWTAGTPIASN